MLLSRRNRIARWVAGLGVMVTAVSSVGGCATQRLAPPAAKLPDSLAVFGRLPSIEDAAVSPDGSHLALVRNLENNHRVIVVVSLAGRQVVGTVRAGDAKLRAIQWIDAKHLLLTTSVTGIPPGLIGDPHEWFMVQVYDIETRTTRPLLTGTENDTMNVTFGRPMVRSVGGKPVLFASGYYVTDVTKPGLFRIDVDSGRETLIYKGSRTTRGWLVDSGGEMVAERQYHNQDQRWSLHILQNGRMTEAASGSDPFDDTRILGFDATGDLLIVTATEDAVGNWTSLSFQDGSLSAPWDEAGTDVILDRLTDRLIGMVHAGDHKRYSFRDPRLQAYWDKVLQSFGGAFVSLVSASDDFTKLVVLVQEPRRGYTYELVDLLEQQVELVGSAYEGLPQLAETRRLTYSATDGLRIPAYLTLPNGRHAAALPLVVLPHGGPASRDSAEFDWWAQALAAGGYAVLQPNYRGSTVSNAMLASGFGEWGRKMQTDLSDGVRFLAAEGIVDPTRVCIVGASYGGYAALAGVTLQNGLYRCAVSVGGVTNLGRFVHRSGGRENATQRWWRRFIGARGQDDPILDALSPLVQANVASAPVLLIHGRDDTVVPYEQSATMAEALEQAGRPVSLVALDGEDHWLSRAATRMQMLEHVFAFLHTHNPP